VPQTIETVTRLQQFRAGTRELARSPVAACCSRTAARPESKPEDRKRTSAPHTPQSRTASRPVSQPPGWQHRPGQAVPGGRASRPAAISAAALPIACTRVAEASHTRCPCACRRHIIASETHPSQMEHASAGCKCVDVVVEPSRHAAAIAL
jgi:hypothetical protein